LPLQAGKCGGWRHEDGYDVARVEEAYTNASGLRQMDVSEENHGLVETASTRFLNLREGFEQKYPNIAAAYRDAAWMMEGKTSIAQSPHFG